MANRLPLIVGFGGFNAAGRSSGHEAYERMIFESLSAGQKQTRVASLANLMGLAETDEKGVLDGTLVRRIGKSYFNVDNAPMGKTTLLKANSSDPASFVIAGKDLPDPLPEHWKAFPLDEGGRRFKIIVDHDQELLLSCTKEMPVQSAGQLPTGFDPASMYRSLHHPRGLQMTVLGASDAVHSVGIQWQHIMECVTPDEVAVFSASTMCQLDNNGFGGMLKARQLATRVTSKQLALGMMTMPADFINAYVLGSAGVTGSVAGACATFLYNLRYGVEEIKSGRRKVAIVGGSEAPILPEIIDGYAAMGALATDADLRKLDELRPEQGVDYRRASRPFGANCGFTLAESAQYVVLMADDLAMELGATIYGCVPGVYVNADGHKKSISAPGAGNYVTVGRAVGLAKTLLGEDSVRYRSFMQAHGSGTPQNRVTESKIFHEVAKAFGINSWPVAAVKSYLGHSLGAASGDQLVSSLGVFAHGILPGIKSISEVAGDVYDERLRIATQDTELGVDNCEIAFLNSKGFGGNNATATLFSPSVTSRFLKQRYGKQEFTEYLDKNEAVSANFERYITAAERGEFSPIYEFGQDLIDEDAIRISAEEIQLPGYCNPVSFVEDEGFSGEF